MTYLLDTHAFIWAVLDTGKLSGAAKGLIVNTDNEICVSTVSFWEISLKTRLGKLSFENVEVKDFPKYARKMNFTIIDLKEKEAITFYELPLKANHKDPFDRMLIWQAITNDMGLISIDDKFDQYQTDGLQLIW